MTLSDRRMNSLLNKSPESGYIHSRNGASESQHLCTMKEEMFKKISVTEDTNQKAARTRTLVRWERGCSAPSTGAAARELSQGSSTMRWAPRPMSKSNPDLSDQDHIRISNSFPPRTYTENTNYSTIGSLTRVPTFT